MTYFSRRTATHVGPIPHDHQSRRSGRCLQRLSAHWTELEWSRYFKVAFGVEKNLWAAEMPAHAYHVTGPRSSISIAGGKLARIRIATSIQYPQWAPTLSVARTLSTATFRRT